MIKYPRMHQYAHLPYARKKAMQTYLLRRAKVIKELRNRYRHLGRVMFGRDVTIIALAMLYLCEGSKQPNRASITFSNSDQMIVRMFLRLLRRAYDVDPSKFRCTVQGRADQDFEQLERHWSRVTGVPLTQFYASRIDARTHGKPSKKVDYKGVCRIDYFSAAIYQELAVIGSLLTEGP